MNDAGPLPSTINRPDWLLRLVKAEPRAPLVVPYLAYLFLFMLTDLAPDGWGNVAIAVHALASLFVCWMFWPFLPPLGSWHLLPAAVIGLFAAWMWVAGQHWLEGIKVAGHSLGDQFFFFRYLPFLFPGGGEPHNPHAEYGDGPAFWAHVALKITRACTAVPIVEELFWRGFILRAFVSWHRPEAVPVGTFTWVSFLGSSLLSIVQHPGNWGVSVACWMLFNGLFYWTRSLRCLMLTHAITNFALYVYVVRTGDWQFW